MPRRTCGHARPLGDCFLCRGHINPRDYWDAVKWCRKLPKGVVPRVRSTKRKDVA